MDIFLGKVTQQAMNYAIRSGITITASYAIKQSSRLLKSVEGFEKDELQILQERLDSKIRIISPAIDMIDLISARGNTSLESAVSLTKSIRWEIQTLGQRLSVAANAEEHFRRQSSKVRDHAQHTLELQQIAQAIRKLLTRIEDAVPLISLAITASGASLSSRLPSTVSPSRLLQASTFLTAGDSQYAGSATKSVQIGPTFILSMYMLFQGHVRPETEQEFRDNTWKEVIHKAVVRLMRVPLDCLRNLPGDSDRPPSEFSELEDHTLMHDSKADEYAYQLTLIEDLEDGRVHTFDDDEPQPSRLGDIEMAGIRESIPIHELSKIFYADTGKILNIGSDGEANNPILLLKRDTNAIPPRRMVDRYSDADSVTQSAVQYDDENSLGPDASREREPGPYHTEHASPASRQSAHVQKSTSESWRLPPDLDPEWIAFEVYTEAEDSDSETDADDTPPRPHTLSRGTSLGPGITSALSRLDLGASNPSSSSQATSVYESQPAGMTALPPIRTSLSLLETLLRLLSLQQFQQTPHLSIPDELLTFFLSESASTGAASNDGQERKRLREQARRRVGFDPYDESPIKRRGEDYQYHTADREGSERWHGDERSFTDERFGSPVGSERPRYDDEGYHTYDMNVPLRRSTPSMPSTPRDRRTPDSATAWAQNPHAEKGDAVQSPATISGTMSRPPPLTRRSDGGRYGLRKPSVLAERRGSPLARPGTGITDEGLGTSPTSITATETPKDVP